MSTADTDRLRQQNEEHFNARRIPCRKCGGSGFVGEHNYSGVCDCSGGYIGLSDGQDVADLSEEVQRLRSALEQIVNVPSPRGLDCESIQNWQFVAARRKDIAREALDAKHPDGKRTDRIASALAPEERGDCPDCLIGMMQYRRSQHYEPHGEYIDQARYECNQCGFTDDKAPIC